MAGQPQKGNLTNFWFDVTGLKFVEPGEEPSNIVEKAKPFDAIVSFEFGGPTALFMVSLGLQMSVMVEFEGIGVGTEHDTPPKVVITTPVLLYNETITIPANTLDVGTYTVKANVVGPGGSLIAGFSDKAEILQVI